MASSRTVLITGGAGFIGGNFVRYLRQNYPQYRILVLDALTYASSLETLPKESPADGNLEFWYGNVQNPEIVDHLVSQSDTIVHFAAETHVTRSVYDSYEFFATDVMGTQRIANAVAKFRKRIDRFIHISTSEVYGTAVVQPMDEDHPLLPVNPYAGAKAGADRLVFSYWTTYKIPAVIIRPFNSFGPYQHVEKVIPRFITSCLLDEPLPLHGSGEFKRDWLHVDELCRALDLVLHAPPAKVLGEVFNVGSGHPRAVSNVAQTILRMMGKDVHQVTNEVDRPGQVLCHHADIKKIGRVLGWEPRLPFEEGLTQTIQWYVENRPWWEKRLWMRAVPIRLPDGQVIRL